LKWYILYFIYTLKLGELENSLQREHDVIMTQSCVYCLFPFPHSLIWLESGCTLAFHLSLWCASYVILFLGGMGQTNRTKTNSSRWVQ
jgi:hypothetical protein